MLQAFQKILKNATMLNHEASSEKLLKWPMKVAHNLSKDEDKDAFAEKLQKRTAAERAHLP